MLSLLGPVQDPLVQFNGAFREGYAKAKADCLVRGGPVLVVSGEWLMLYRNNVEAAREPIRPARYHRLKAVAHVPLALQVLVNTPGGLPETTRRTLRGLAATARAELGSWCSGPVRVRQERILDASLGLLDELRGPAGLARGRLAGFTAGLGPLLLANAAEAAGLELEALHGKVLGFRKAMDPADWRALRVVIIGSHMARDGEVTLQYFSRLLDEPREGGRIVYAEGLWQPKDALDLLATHQLDRTAGAAFFGDPMRMHRDILADGAEAWLKAHLPAAGPAMD